MTELHAQLAAPAKMVAEQLVPPENGEAKRHKKVDHSQPSEENIEEAQAEIQDRPYPQIVIPMSLHWASRLCLSTSSMQFAGHDAAHLPQPTHASALISAQQPCMTVAAWRGQTLSQVPQATQFF